jgi:protein SCO1/2
LKAYAKKNQVNDAKWNLVTGDKRDIHAGQKILLKIGQPSELYDMVHTENFVLVDTKKEFVAFMTEQTDIKRLIERHYFKYKLKT